MGSLQGASRVLGVQDNTERRLSLNRKSTMPPEEVCIDQSKHGHRKQSIWATATLPQTNRRKATRAAKNYSLETYSTTNSQAVDLLGRGWRFFFFPTRGGGSYGLRRFNKFLLALSQLHLWEERGVRVEMYGCWCLSLCGKRMFHLVLSISFKGVVQIFVCGRHLKTPSSKVCHNSCELLKRLPASPNHHVL